MKGKGGEFNMIGSFSVQVGAEKASGRNRFMISPGTSECCQPLSIIQEVSSDVCMTVAWYVAPAMAIFLRQGKASQVQPRCFFCFRRVPNTRATTHLLRFCGIILKRERLC